MNASATQTPTEYATDDERWAAVVARDTAADGHFVLAVRTTGICCRTGCLARQPLRQNVAFYDSPTDAERAGYRPCKRCTPRGKSLDELHAALVVAACRTIETAEDAPTLEGLATTAGLSPYHFHRIFRSVTGLTTKAYAAAHRAELVRRALPAADSVTRAIYDAGFGSNGGFYANMPSMIGMTPSTFRASGEGARIRFAIGQSSLGPVLVAATDLGVCSIMLGDEPEAMVRQLGDQFSSAALIGDEPAFAAHVASVIGLIETPGSGSDLPLDVRGTAFQHRVWQALHATPPGTTVTYPELAEQVGAPRAVRAVAHACATNRLAVAIPCHRVVCKSGDLAGYRWGIERKRELLRREAAAD
jgi:AraC family transcriptional regulator of adaptative response/methylated-DNA-[protein]-cysteine methyltransferase